MAEEPGESFTIRDRRRFRDEPSEEAESHPSESSETGAPTLSAPVTEVPEPFEDEAFRAEMAAMAGMEDVGESALPDIYSVLLLFLQEMRSYAWLRMGLVANPATGQIERDLSQARVAIDTAVFLAGQLEAVVPPEERLPLRALISDLQVNFVEQGKRP